MAFNRCLVKWCKYFWSLSIPPNPRPYIKQFESVFIRSPESAYNQRPMPLLDQVLYMPICSNHGASCIGMYTGVGYTGTVKHKTENNYGVYRPLFHNFLIMLTIDQLIGNDT